MEINIINISNKYKYKEIKMTLTQILQKIRSVFYTKSEIDAMGGGTDLSTTIDNKANDSDVVHTSGDETIGGTKTFSNNLILADTGSVILGNSIRIQGGSLWDNGGRITVNPKTVDESIILQAFNTEGNSAYIFSNNSVYPYIGGINNLGTSTNKWKTINGINPGALSLPDASQGIDLKSHYTNQGDSWVMEKTGWLLINCINVTDGAKKYLNAYGGCVHGENYGGSYLLLPVLKGGNVTIFWSYQELNKVILFPCQGNV